MSQPHAPERIAAVLGHRPRRALLLGSRGAADRDRWAACASEVVHRQAFDSSMVGSGPWDVVVLDGALEQERWDRWLLQRLHREMPDGAILSIRADHLFDLGSAAGLVHIASRIVRQLRRRLGPRGAIPIADRSAFRGRRYRTEVLDAMLRGVAFEVIDLAGEGHGWPRPLATALGPLGRRTASHLVATARRLPSLWGEGRPFPTGETIHSRFRSTHAAALRARDAWAARLGGGGSVVELDVATLARSGVLVFSPHPDDELIGCGGTLLEVAARGGAVTIVQVTDGSDSAAFVGEPEAVRRQVRLDEARRVADGLGARELVCLMADNRNLQADPGHVAAFREVLSRVRPGTVFAPSFIDIHPDHQTVLTLLAEALRELPPPLPDVALYEVWSLVPHTAVHDVSRWMSRLEDLLLTYETALKVDDYVHMVAERLLFHALAHRGQPGYLEGFEIHTGSRFLELARARPGDAVRT